MKLRARFTALFAILAAATIVVLVLVSDAVVGRAVSERVSERFGRELDHLAGDLAARSRPRRAPSSCGLAAASSSAGSPSSPGTGRFSTTRTSGRPRSPAIENHAKREEVQQAARGGEGTSRRFSATARRQLLYVARRLADGGVLRLAASEARLREVQNSYLWTMRLAIAAACLLLFLIGSAASRRFSQPIADLTRERLGDRRGRLRPRPAARRGRGSADALFGGPAHEGLPQHRAREGGRRAAAGRDGLRDAARRPRRRGREAPGPRVERPLRASWRACPRRPAAASTSSCGRSPSTSASRRPCAQGRPRSGPCGCRTTASGRSPWRPCPTGIAPPPWASCATSRGSRRPSPCAAPSSATSRTSFGRRSPRSRPRRRLWPTGSPDQAETAELLGLIRRQSDRMRELIDDLMDLAQIESGAVPLVREEIPLHELLSEVAEDLGSAARERRVDVRVRRRRVRIGGRRPPPARAARPQPHRQRDQVLARRARRSSSACGARAGAPGSRSRTSGPGIPKAERDKIFQRFYQVDRSRSKVRPGSGLGLAIVKHIAQLHGAAVDVEGEVGQGSKFHVRFPAVA